MDGDIIVRPESMKSFLLSAASCNLLIGLTEPSSEEAVYAKIEDTADGLSVVDFSRTSRSQYEWANLVVAPPNLFEEASGFVFERLMEKLPSPFAELIMSEVDTQSDLERAIHFAKSLSMPANQS